MCLEAAVSSVLIQSKLVRDNKNSEHKMEHCDFAILHFGVLEYKL